MTIECPVCDDHLRCYAFNHLRIDVCDSCQVVWLDRGEWTKVRQAQGLPAEAEAVIRARFEPIPGVPLVCPRCEEDQLIPGRAGSLTVWHCGPCNGFLLEPHAVIEGGMPDGAIEAAGFRKVEFSRPRVEDIKVSPLGIARFILGFLTHVGEEARCDPKYGFRKRSDRQKPAEKPRG